MKKFVLCADDFAISESVSAGILDLVDRGRITATSCLVTSNRWFRDADELKSRAARIDVGLHLNLTDDSLIQHDPSYCPVFPSYPDHFALIMRSLLRQLDRKKLAREIEQQLDRFVEGWGTLPDYLDGHLHVHLLPVVREALMSVYERRLKGTDCYVRNIANIVSGRGDWVKGAIIRALGGRQFGKLLEASDTPSNSMFGGIYAFTGDVNYRRMMRAWLHGLNDSGLLMCHPAMLDPSGADPIGVYRWQEYQYLSGDKFDEDCKEAQILPSRFQQTNSAKRKLG